MNNKELQNELQALCAARENNERQYRWPASLQLEDLEWAEQELRRQHRPITMSSAASWIVGQGSHKLTIQALPMPVNFIARSIKQKPFTPRKRFNPKHDRHKG